MLPVRFRAYDADGAVAVMAATQPDGRATFHVDGPVALVVFYAGDVDAEFVVGSVDVPADHNVGDLDVALPA